MSKDIKAGTWWLDIDGDVCYVSVNHLHLPFLIGEDDVPIQVWYKLPGGGEISGMWVSGDHLVRELPGCTGFDYKEPPPVFDSSVMEIPPQWIPYTDDDGRRYMVLGYLCQPVDATAG